MAAERTSAQVRAEFLEFFRDKGHTVVPSASLVPADDPTLLFINAGMNQFKDVFLGQASRPYVRAVDTQKCLRVSGKHNDLEEVGHDTYHHTFFEMLGNWSFGDYFKEEAIAWAWELLHRRWGLPADRLYATVHEGDQRLNLPPDEEAAELWKRHLPDHQVLYGSTKDNFWMMGDTGPCGPCSEIHIDLRSDRDRAQVDGADRVNRDDPMVIELWNLVFIQFNAQPGGGLESLDACHVDTGMGLERLTAVLQGKQSTYDTDAFAPLMDQIASLSPLSGVRGYDDIAPQADYQQVRIAMRVIADHVRALVFCMADGVVPGNVGRGYVLRRILRRAVRYGYTTLQLNEPFLCRLVKTVTNQMGDAYPGLRSQAEQVAAQIRGEETAFLRTLGRGLRLFDKVADCIDLLTSESIPRARALDQIARDHRTQDLLAKAYGKAGPDAFVSVASLGRVPGEVAFLLHDTYGFPIDLTALMAKERGRSVDQERFDALMAEQKDRARKAATFDLPKTVIAAGTPSIDELLSVGHDSQFMGYDSLRVEEARILDCNEASKTIVLDRTPFYAERGGQIGDTGVIHINGQSIRVLDTRLRGSEIVHVVDAVPVHIGAPVIAEVDAERRHRIAKHHTATHLMHAALREVLGPSVTQKGSLVSAGHLRFDFNHYEAVSASDLESIQARVNEVIQRNVAGEIDDHVPYPEAIARGATALFGEKYGEHVRVVTFDPSFSVELCGGTHVAATGELGLFLLQSEGSIASGIRRVEAVTGLDAMRVVVDERTSLLRVRSRFKGQQRPAEASVSEIIETNQRLRKEVEKLRHAQLAARLEGFIRNAQAVGDISLVTGRLEAVGMDVLRLQGDELRRRLDGTAVGVLGARDPHVEKAYLVAVVTDELVLRGVKAGAIVGALARQMGGGGGGRPELATAGGRQPDKLDDVLAAAVGLVQEMSAVSA